MDEEILRLIETVDELLPDPTEKLEDDCLICECFCVSARDIRNLCQGQVNLELLEEHYHLGQGCGSCKKNLTSWIDKIF